MDGFVRTTLFQEGEVADAELIFEEINFLYELTKNDIGYIVLLHFMPYACVCLCAKTIF